MINNDNDVHVDSDLDGDNKAGAEYHGPDERKKVPRIHLPVSELIAA